MTIEQRIEAAEKLLAEAKAELAKTTTRKNWPEKVEAGMVFQSPETTATWMATDVDGLFVCLKGETDSFKAAGRTRRLNPDNVPHAGHARDILTIRTDAHEPTGAELVGRNIPDGAEWIQEFQGAFYKGVFPNMFVWSSYEDEPKHWCKSIGAHEKLMTPISEWLAR